MLIKEKSELKKIIDSAKNSGKSVLIKKGVFDIIHPGHVYTLNLFKDFADIVIILIQSDEFTKKKKGPTRPINNQEQRALVIDGIKGVDYTYLDESNSREEYIEFLKFLKPTIVAITALDEEKTNLYLNSEWELKEFTAKKIPDFSTTGIINKVLEKNKIN